MTKISCENIMENIRAAIKDRPLVFLVGAGISFDPPSSLPIWPQLKTMVAKIFAYQDSNFEKTLEEAMQNIRPEIFFQVIYNVIGKRALYPLEVLNPITLNTEEELVASNSLHFFLAEMLIKNHIVLTANFDDMIERAYEEITGQKPNVVIFDKDFQRLYEEPDSLKSGYIIKIHGSFVNHEGGDCRDSIIAILQQVEREFPEPKRKLVKKLINQYDFIAMGYSGQDDYDLYTFLLEPSPGRSIWWIRHPKGGNPEKWQFFSKDQLESQNKELGVQPAPYRKYEILNPNSIVMAYSDGILIEAHAASFVKSLSFGKYSFSIFPQDIEGKVNQKVQAILKQWGDSINSAEKHYILSGIFETAGGNFLDQAQEHYNKACENEACLITARNVLKRGVIHYKKGGRVEFEKAKHALEKALNDFKNLSSIADQAKTYAQMLLVFNRLAVYEEGLIEKAIEYGEKAINFLLQLSELERTYVFELAQTLRGQALASSRAVPDIAVITEGEQRKHYTEILDESAKLCETSLRLLQQIGNRSGERGIGQTHNVLGLITLKVGQYREARGHFTRVLKLAAPSRFLRESFQGYRNLALSEYNLAFKEPNKKNEWLEKAIRNYDNAIVCLGGNPNQLNSQPGTDEFNARFNKSRARIELDRLADINATKEELTTIKDATSNWHWKANVLGSLCHACMQLTQYENVLKYIEEMLETYEEVKDQQIERMAFGVQNARQNLQAANNWFNQLVGDDAINARELQQRCLEQLRRVSNLSQYVPPIPFKSWASLISKIEAVFLK